MADRKANTPGAPEAPEEIVQLDNDDRWQARLDEARARREIALREKAAQPKKPRLKPWEEEAPATAPKPAKKKKAKGTAPAEVQPIIQEKPADEKALDLADRLEKSKRAAAKKPETPRRAPVKMAPPVTEEPEATPEPVPRIVPQFRANRGTERARFEALTPPEPELGGEDIAAPRPRARRESSVIAPGAPDVIDLAQRYASTLKPPVNVTRSFDPPPREEPSLSQPAPEAEVVPLPVPPIHAASRRPFGLGLAVLLFSLIPLAQMAPPLEKGPEAPGTPFFALPPALGLTTSMVWPIELTRSGEWGPGAWPSSLRPTVPLAPSPLKEAEGISAAPGLGGLSPGAEMGGVTWQGADLPNSAGTVAPLGAAPGPDAPAEALAPVPKPRPRPEAEAGREDALLDVPAPTARPERDGAAAPGALSVTILAPSAAELPRAAAYALEAEARGHRLTQIRQVDLPVSEPNIRYFHPEDRAAAQALARAFGATLRDFTWFQPGPAPGTAELWLSGRPRLNSSGRAGPRSAPPTVTVTRKTPTLIERMITGSEGPISLELPDPRALLDAARSGAGDN
ncbi:MAG: hypothetical protein OIF48_17840 [Silicimonas sp.]|nr:hypothetical protein [Silicimonas sp.]